MVLNFYNMRRRELLKAKPNDGHKGLTELEKDFEVHIITQNIDNLHEQAGSTKVLHLHGELMKARSAGDESLVYEIDPEKCDIHLGDLCEKGYQLRPHIVWFGEAVPMIQEAEEITRRADISNEQICKVLRIGMRTIDRVKKRFIEEGLEGTLERHPSSRVYEGKVDGDLEAKLVSLCCSKPPDGFANWSLRLLADRMVELEYIDYISHVTVGKVLKKTNLSLGKCKDG